MKITSQSNVQALTYGMENNQVVDHKLSENSKNLQMLMLRSGLYSNKVWAVCREYLTNARDAHVAAGNEDTAIDVTIPNRFGNDLIIRDYGPGMSVDFVKEVYVTYAESTKRDSNEQTGMWGLGSKSAYAYSDTFQVISYYQGVKYIWLAQSQPDGSGSFTLISSTPTDEPSGVAICVSIVSNQDINKFRNGIRHYSRFLDVPVKINSDVCNGDGTQYRAQLGDIAYSFVTDPKKQKEYSWRSVNSDLYIVQGGVPYQVMISNVQHNAKDTMSDGGAELIRAIENLISNYKYVGRGGNGFRFHEDIAIEVPLGTFMPDISRENLQFAADGSTYRLINKYLLDIYNDILDRCQALVEDKLKNLNNYQAYRAIVSAINEQEENSASEDLYIAKRYLDVQKWKQKNEIEERLILNWHAEPKVCHLDTNSRVSNQNIRFTFQDDPGAMSFWYLNYEPQTIVYLYTTNYKLNQRVKEAMTAIEMQNKGAFPYTKVLAIRVEEGTTVESFKQLFTSSQVENSIWEGYEFKNVHLLAKLAPKKTAPRRSKATAKDTVTLAKSWDYNSDRITTKTVKEDLLDSKPTVYLVTYRKSIVLAPSTFDPKEDNSSLSLYYRCPTYNTCRMINLLFKYCNVVVYTFAEWNRAQNRKRNPVDFSQMIYAVDCFHPFENDLKTHLMVHTAREFIDLIPGRCITAETNLASLALLRKAESLLSCASLSFMSLEKFNLAMKESPLKSEAINILKKNSRLGSKFSDDIFPAFLSELENEAERYYSVAKYIALQEDYRARLTPYTFAYGMKEAFDNFPWLLN